MNIHAISNASAPQQIAKVKETKTDTDNGKVASTDKKTTVPQTKPVDTVQISSIAKQALQEATETAAQTAQEARGGDSQAKRLLAREEAAKAAQQPSANQPNEGAEKLLK